MSSNQFYSFFEEGVESFEYYHKAALENNFRLLKMLPQLVFKIDANERFTFLNDFGFKLLKHNKDFQKDFFLKDIFAPESLEDFRLYLSSEAKDEYNANNDFVVLRKDGSRMFLSVNLNKIAKENKVLGFIGIGVDITEKKQAELKLREANDSRMKLFSIIAHDLKNPFNTIVGFSNLIMLNPEKYSKEKIQHFVSHIHSSALQAHNLLENLLEWSRAKSGKIQFTPNLFNVILVLEETIGLFVGTAEKKEIKFEVKISKEALVFADKNMVRTVLRNLISNAVKFTHRKGKVEISLTEQEGFFAISVKDNGIGINKDKMDSLFRIENNGSSPGTENEKGTGLGLILCKEFMNMNSGSIEAESKINEGSTFTIRLPKNITE